LPARSSGFALLALLAAAVSYLVGLLTGAVTFVGYEAKTQSQTGAVRTSYWPISFGMPAVWLEAQQGIRADFAVDASFGAVAFTVAPPLPLRTSLQAATAYVEGKRAGSVLFVAGAPGWYTFKADPSPLGGPRCGSPELSLHNMVIGNPKCPAYDVSYSVTWQLALQRDPGVAHALPRLTVPGPNGMLVTLRIGG
jgi:hypothetical protein